MTLFQVACMLTACFVQTLSMILAYQDISVAPFCEPSPIKALIVLIQMLTVFSIKIAVLVVFIKSMMDFWWMDQIAFIFLSEISTGSFLSMSYSTNSITCKSLSSLLSLEFIETFSWVSLVILGLVIGLWLCFQCHLQAIRCMLWRRSSQDYEFRIADDPDIERPDDFLLKT